MPSVLRSHQITTSAIVKFNQDKTNLFSLSNPNFTTAPLAKEGHNVSTTGVLTNKSCELRKNSRSIFEGQRLHPSCNPTRPKTELEYHVLVYSTVPKERHLQKESNGRTLGIWIVLKEGHGCTVACLITAQYDYSARLPGFSLIVFPI